MPKLLQINSALNVGSTGRIAEQIGLLAEKNGWEVYSAHGFRYCQPSKLKSIQVSSKFEEYIHAGLQSLLFDRHGFGSKKATEKFIRQIEKIKPDIIHLHNLHGYYLNIELLFNYLENAGIPVVWTLHDCWSFTGHCSHFSFIGCDKWKTQCQNCPQSKSYPRTLFWDNSKLNFEDKKRLFSSVKNMTIVPVSYWLGNLVSQSFLGKYPIRVMYNGIDLSTFNKKPRNISLCKKYNIEDKFTVIGVAFGWSPRKGLADFLKLRTLLNEDIQIILVGLTDKEVSALPKRILGIRRTTSANELSELYSLVDVYVNCTYEDNFPTTNIEALACGTPVITYNTGGSPESITDDTGFIVEQGDVGTLVDKIEFLKNRGKESYSRTCQTKAINNYNKDERFADYIKLYKKLINKE